MKTKSTITGRFPWTRNGSTGFYNDANKWVFTGSMMGRPNTIHPGDDLDKPFRLWRVPINNGGYDAGGAYWGVPANLYCSWGESKTEQVHCFVRAWSRQEAKRKINTYYPNVKFIR